MAFAGIFSMLGMATVSAENFEVAPKTVTTISGDYADECFYDASATEWKANYGKISGSSAFGIGTAGSSSVVLVQFDASEYADKGITRAVLEFHSYCTVAGKNSQLHVAYVDLDPDLTTATWTSVNSLGATITDIYTSDEWVKPEGADLSAVVSDQFLADENDVVTFGIFTGTAREQAVSDIKLVLYTDVQVPYSYTVNAVNADGDILKTIAEGADVDGTPIVAPYPRYILGEDGTLYNRGVTNKEYNHKFTIKSDGQVENLEYSVYASDVVYLTEGEDIEGAKVISDGNASVRASGSKTGYNDEQDLVIATVPAGKYKIVAGLFDASTSPSLVLNFAVGDNVVFEAAASGVNMTEQTSGDFVLAGASNTLVLKAGGSSSSQKSLDYVYIQKTGDLAVETLNFNESEYPTSSNDSSDGDINENLVITEGDLTVTVTPKEEGNNTANRFWGTNNGPQLRVYSGKITFEVPLGKAILGVKLNTAKWNTENKFNGVEAATGEWTGNSRNVVLNIAGNTQINSIEVVVNDADDATTKYVDLVVAENIAALKALESGTEACLTLNGTKVTAWYAKLGQMYSYIEDETGGLMVDGNISGMLDGENVAMNGTLIGEITVDKYGYHTLSLSDNTDASSFTSEPTTVTATPVTLAELSANPAKYGGQFIKLENVTLEMDEYGENGFLRDEEGNSVDVFDQFYIFGYTGIPTSIKGFKSISGYIYRYVATPEFHPYGEYEIAEEEIVEVGSIAELKQQSNGTTVKLALNDAKVTVSQMGHMGSIVLLEDATAAVQVQGSNSWWDDESGYLESMFTTPGQTFNGYVYCKYVDEYGSRAIADVDKSSESEVSVSETTVVPADVTVAAAKSMDYDLRYVKISDAKMLENGYGLYLAQGDEQMPIYDLFGKLMDEEYNPIVYENVEYAIGVIMPQPEGYDENDNITSYIYTFVPLEVVEKVVSGQVYKEFSADEVFLPTEDNVAAAVAEGWATGGETRVDNKKGTIDPATGDILESATAFAGVGLKQGNKSKTFVVYITGVEKLVAYGVTTSSSEARYLSVTATPVEGDVLTASEASEPNTTAVVELLLDKNQNYAVEFTGVGYNDEGELAGADVVLHGINFIVTNVEDGINGVNANVNLLNGDVYSISGTKVRNAGESLEGLAKGLYIIGGKKVVVK